MGTPNSEVTGGSKPNLSCGLALGTPSLVDYDAPGVEEARRRNELPSLAEPKPKGYMLVNEDLIDRVIGPSL